MSKKLFYMVLGIVLFTSVSALAYTLTSGEVIYETNDEIADVNNNNYVDVQDAIDDLYTKCTGNNGGIKITFDTQGGSLVNAIKLNSAGKVGNLPIPKKDGYYFEGWYTEADGGTEVTSDTEISSSVTYYAHWTASSFATDNWDTIIAHVNSGHHPYKVGDEKTITLTGTYAGNYKVRVANTTTPAECNDVNFSQTACGFVVEFVDIITNYQMNGTSSSNSTNVGGWPASEMRTLVNGTIYNALPTEVKNAIIPTTVVSGHGKTSGETNFTSTDKLYLLSTHEVWEDADGITSKGIDYYDKAYSRTRQLDYYKNNNVTTSNYALAIKKESGSANTWWLRSASSSYIDYFYRVYSDGSVRNFYSSKSIGVAPAFRF